MSPYRVPVAPKTTAGVDISDLFCKCGAATDLYASRMDKRPTCAKCAGPVARFLLQVRDLELRDARGPYRCTIGPAALDALFRDVKAFTAASMAHVDGREDNGFRGSLFGVDLYLDTSKPPDYMRVDAA